MNPGLGTIAGVLTLGILSKKGGRAVQGKAEEFLRKLEEMGFEDYPWETKPALAYLWVENGIDCRVIVIFVRYNRTDPAIILETIKVGGTDECLRQRYGTKAMEMITAAADETGTTLKLMAVPFGTMSMPEEKLKEWYTNFGFVPTVLYSSGGTDLHSDTLMERIPKSGSKSKSNESQIKVIRVERRRAGFKPQRLMRSLTSGRLHDPNKTVGAWVTLEGHEQRALRNYRTVQPILLAEARKIGLFRPQLIFMNVYQSRTAEGMWEAKWEMKE